MKKLLAVLLVFVMILALAACKPHEHSYGDDGKCDCGATDPNYQPELTPDDIPLMSYEEYAAAEVDAPVAVECYVQAHQSWWDNKITVYAADEDGGYFIYDMACSEEDAAKLTPGAKIEVRGYKAEWAGEVEIIDAKFKFVEGDPYIAEAVDLTDELGSEDIIDYQNRLAYFDSLTVEKVEFKNGEPGDDIYLTVAKDGKSYSFCVERYLTGPDTEVYKTVSALKAGDVIHVEGFLYWYEGINTHVTAVYNGGVLTHEEYVNAKLNQHVKVECYVQAHQSWWDDKITVYAADENGGYFLYELACSEEDAAKLTQGAKIRVDGYKAEWAGEIEIVDATFEFVEADPYIAEAKDVTELLGTDELIKHQNELVLFCGLTVKSISYKNGEPGDDIYVDFTYGGATYSFCVERYLTGPDTELYQLVGTLEAGDVVDVMGFLYWYEGVNTHIVSITATAE